MKFRLPLIAVRDMERTKRFYTEILGQRITLDLEQNVSFEGFAVQLGYDRLVGVDGFSTSYGKHGDHELYFEEDDFDAFEKKIAQYDLDCLHPVKMYPWGQRSAVLRSGRTHCRGWGEHGEHFPPPRR